MTPKEKANKIIVAISAQLPYYSKIDNLRKSKICALFLVEEIISASPSKPIESDNGIFASDIIESTDFWLKVKSEIENL